MRARVDGPKRPGCGFGRYVPKHQWLKAQIDAVGYGQGSDALHELRAVAKLPLTGFSGLVGSKIDDLRAPIFGGKVVILTIELILA